MNNFGIAKNKILAKITESYENKNKDGVKEVISLLKENKDFNEMYLFYEDIEDKYFDDKNQATLFVEEISTILKDKSKKLSAFTKTINKKYKDIEVDTNPIYECLDKLGEEDSLLNVDKKMIAKKRLINHLITTKTKSIKEEYKFTPNQTLLHAILANNFNVLYENSLNDDEKDELKKILSLSGKELETNVNELKEEILNKTNKMLEESNNNELTSKLEHVRIRVEIMKPSKFNYYKLMELKKDLE